MKQQENVSHRLPRTAEEEALFRSAISAFLLNKIPDVWCEFDENELTEVEQKALFLLIAAGMVENRAKLRMHFQPLGSCLEFEFTMTGERGLGTAVMPLLQELWPEWRDSWQSWRSGDFKELSPVHCERVLPQYWRLTAEGVQARKDLEDGNIALVYEFVLKTGFFKGRGVVRGSGHLLNRKRIMNTNADTTSVKVENWNQGADAIGQAVAAAMQRLIESGNLPRQSGGKSGRKQGASADGANKDHKAFEEKFWSVYERAGLAEACRECGLTESRGKKLRDKLKMRRYRASQKAEKERSNRNDRQGKSV